jgi:hypothetical protein
MPTRIWRKQNPVQTALLLADTNGDNMDQGLKSVDKSWVVKKLSTTLWVKTAFSRFHWA